MNAQPPKINKALCSYMFFLKEQRALVKNSQQASEGNVLMKELVRQGAQEWGKMSDQDKQPYQLMQEADRLRYDIEVKT